MLAQRARGGGAISRNPLIMSETAPRMFIKQEASLGDISTSQSEEPAGTVGGNNWVKTQAVGGGRLGHMPGNLCDKNESLTANNYLQVCGKKEYFSDRHLESNSLVFWSGYMPCVKRLFQHLRLYLHSSTE